MEIKGKVISREIPKYEHRWFSILKVLGEDGNIYILYTAGFAKWLNRNEIVKIKIKNEPKKSKEGLILFFNDYELSKFYKNEEIKVWPVWEKVYTAKRNNAFGHVLYEYKLRIREAIYEEDFENIAELEQYHYASEKEKVALWRCYDCGYIFEANTKTECPKCGSKNVHILEIKGSTAASRFLVIENLNREEYEPKILGYVRVDPPIPLMHRRLPDGTIIKNIREKVFPKEWFHPNFWPELLVRKLYRKLKKKYPKKIARYKLWLYAAMKALSISNTAAARIARVVIHPDYRSDGLGILAVNAAKEWVKERRIPEMRKEKHLIETIAQMARFNPFFEKAGFKYLWDTASGRPVLYYPLTEIAKKYIDHFLETDPVARQHKGRLVIPRYTSVEVLQSPIIFKNVSKIYENILDINNVSSDIRFLLEAFGVKSRVIQRSILRNVNLEIRPREIVVVVGASGAGKTTLLKLIYNAFIDGSFKPSSGEIVVDKSAKVSAMIPNEIEPKIDRNISLIENIYRITRDIYLSVEILNRIGLSDAILYRAKFEELSTGQKERAKLAMLLAEKPSVLIIDEFAAHLDSLTASRVARKLSELARNAGVTLIIATHRKEVIEALAPDKVLFVGYGFVKAIKFEEFVKK